MSNVIALWVRREAGCSGDVAGACGGGRVRPRHRIVLPRAGPRVCRLPGGAKEIRTLRPTLNASVPRGATWVPRTAPGFGVAPPSS